MIFFSKFIQYDSLNQHQKYKDSDQIDQRNVPVHGQSACLQQLHQVLHQVGLPPVSFLLVDALLSQVGLIAQEVDQQELKQNQKDGSRCQTDHLA